MPGDHRKNYSILRLFVVGGRIYEEEYTEDDAIKDFLKMHPEANEAEVRAELTRELAVTRERERPITEWLRTGELPKREQEAE